MKDSKIVFVRNTKREGVQKNEHDRKKVISYFEWLACEHPNDNVISKRMLQFLPEVDEITIPEDDPDRQYPYILYRTNGDTNMFEIPRNHKICWSKLKELAARI